MSVAVKFASVRSVHPVPFADSWQELKSELVDHHESESKMDRELYSPVTYTSNTTRSALNVESVWALVCDLDGESYEQVGDSVSRFEHCAYTTWSHSLADPHFHIVFPLSVPVPGFEWRDSWISLHEYLGIKGDPATKDPSRLYFLPQHKIGAPFQVIANDGELLDPSAHRGKSFSPRRRQSNPTRVHVPNVTDPRWWDAPVDLSQYDGMTQQEIHRDMQREWAEFRKRMAV